MIIGKYTIFLLAFVATHSLQGNAQTFENYQIQTLVCPKKDCKEYRINILDTKDSIYLFDNLKSNYHHDYSITVPTRIRMVDELLRIYENDTLPCCIQVCNYSRSEKTMPSMLTYPLRVEALYIINLLVFGDKTFYFSPFPVLTKGNSVPINYNHYDLDEVYRIYKEWFQKCKTNQFTDFSFPLLGTHFKWYLGKGKPGPTQFSGMAESKLGLFYGWCRE